MLCAGKVGLRAWDEADIAVLHAELYEDIATYTIADSRPWRPIPAGSSASPYAIGEPRDDVALFSVVELAGGEWAGGELAGAALLWAIDSHNRSAHLGLSLRPSFRGRGLGTDVVLALCEYGFAVRGLHRLQVDTLASNAAMISAAVRAGFAQEGTLRGADWVNGEFVRRRGDPRTASQRLDAVTRGAVGRAGGPRARTARGSRARRTAP
jgi:RimJ/RimL family protein N-acetyltransferase